MTTTKTLKNAVMSVACASLLSTVAVPLSVTGAMAAEVDGPKVKWLMSMWGNRRGFSEGVEGLAEYVSEKTDGNFEISIQYGGVLSAPKENLDGLSLGAFESAVFCATYHPDKIPGLNGLGLAALPIGSLEAKVDVIEAYYKNPVIAAGYAKWNSVPLLGIPMPSYEAMGKGDAPKTVDDWKKISLNSSGGVGRMMAALGVNTTVMPAPEVYQGIDRGIINGTTFPYTYAFASYRLHEISDWLTDNWSLGAIVCHAAANKAAYDALPPQYQKLLEDGKAAAYAHQIQNYSDVDIVNEKAFEEAGLERIPMTDEIRAAVDAAAAPSWTAWVDGLNDDGVDGQSLLDYLLKAAADTE